MSVLIICEKPSVAKTVALALGATEQKDGYFSGDGLLVSWCIGHLISMADAGSYDERYKKWRYEDLPILPQTWKYAPTPGKEKQLAILKELLHRSDVSEVVNGCDAGREGELIFRFVYEQAGCTKPFSRLWISSMEDSAIREGFAGRRAGTEYDALYQSALCRARADWLVGINATRLFSVLYHKTLNVGRVLSPTLNLLVERDGKITMFHKEKYHIVHIGCGGVDAESERISDAAAADALRTVCEASQAVCVSLKKEKKTALPPKLFDLTSLQREANRVYGFTAKQTLDYAQSLYEKRFLTYPRTDSNYLTEDMAQTATDLVAALLPVLPFMQGAELTPEIRRVINSAKVSDHHAIIPTTVFAANGFDGLPESEKKLMSLVCCKLLCAVAAPQEYETVTAVFDCGGKPFTAKGKTILIAGWKDIDACFRAALKAKPDEDGAEDAALPELAEGQIFETVTASVSEHYTTPPKPYTEDTLLAAMENAGKEDMPDDAERKGIGTPATRSGIIEKLVSSGFVERRKSKKITNLLPTSTGTALITVLPEQLQSPQLTAEWEHRLKEIERGEIAPDSFMDGIAAMLHELVQTYKPIPGTEVLFPSGREVVGKCPRCGAEVTESPKGFFCENRACSFVLWKNSRFFTAKKKVLTKSLAAALLKNGRAPLKGCYSEKTGKTYDASVLLEDDGQRTGYKMVFDNG
ncbi:MAG: DNA topoisomerase 3 [Oscillospiraceae bacterium]